MVWYRTAKRLVSNTLGIGGGIRLRPSTRNETANTPSEVAQLGEEEELRREMKKRLPSQMTIEQKLETTPNREGYMSVPTPKALNDASRVLPSGINDHHETTNMGHDATQPGTFSEEWLEDPDPATRHRR